MKTLHQITDRTVGRIVSKDREAERGFTLAETLFVLVLAALGIVGAVALFNAATDRMGANRVFQGLTPWSVDNMQFKQQYFTDLGTVPAGNQVPFAATQLSTPPDITLASLGNSATDRARQNACERAGFTWDDQGTASNYGDDTCEDGGGAAQTAVSNPNHQRIMNMASVVRDNNHWVIRIGQQDSIKVAWATQQGTAAFNANFGFGSGGATDVGCNDDTSVIYVLALAESKAVCDGAADNLSHLEHYSSVQWFDINTTPVWTPVTCTGMDDRESAMAVCLQ
ncbi:MAG: hypothetical protein F4118_01920 [Acidimicrobiaceae bacterium]|nr:hypothetical protein [Acidimicrobiaceae bacterium]